MNNKKKNNNNNIAFPKFIGGNLTDVITTIGNIIGYIILTLIGIIPAIFVGFMVAGAGLEVVRLLIQIPVNLGYLPSLSEFAKYGLTGEEAARRMWIIVPVITIIYLVLEEIREHM